MKSDDLIVSLFALGWLDVGEHRTSLAFLSIGPRFVLRKRLFSCMLVQSSFHALAIAGASEKDAMPAWDTLAPLV